MSRWPTIPLGELCTINPRLTASERPAPETAVTFVPMAAVDEVEGRISQPELRTYKQVAKGYTPFKEDDVLLAKITPCMQNGKAAIAHGLQGGIGFGSTEFHVLRSNGKLLPRWLFAFIRQPSFRSAAEANFTGSAGQKRVPADFLKNYVIPVPPLIEQQRIVALLDEADKLRKLRAQSDRRTADLIPALFHEMFGDPVENPRGWRRQLVSSFVSELQGGRNVNPAGADEAAGRFRVLKISAVTWGTFQPDESKPVPSTYEPPASHFVRPGDLLFSRANTTQLVGATSYVFNTPPNLLLPDKLWRFLWKEPRTIEPLFVWWMLQAQSIRRELGARATGTGGSMKNISKPKLMSLDVPVPPLPLQNEFAQRVTEIHAMHAAQAESRQRLDDLYQSMLHRAFFESKL